MKMTLLYVKDTGQAMAAVTRAALAESAPEPAGAGASPEVLALVGDALPVRSFLDAATGFRDPTMFSIPAEHLATLSVDRDEDPLLTPRAYAVVDGKKLEVLPSARLPPPVAIAPGDPSTLQVALPVVVQADLPIALHLVSQTGPALSQHLQGVFKASTANPNVLTFSLRAPLATGTYAVLMLLKGYRPGVRHLVVV